jgi:hypothetical protein
LPHGTILELWAAYDAAHRRAYSVDGLTKADIDAALAEDAADLERARARHAAGIVAFYGVRSALDATAVQVIWFDRLMRAK